MGNLSVSKVAGLSIMLGPIIGLIGYFLAPNSSVIDPIDPTNAMAVIGAVNGASEMAFITGILIIVGLMMMLYGVRYVAMGKGGAGDSLSGYVVTLVSIGIIGWLLTVALNWTIAGVDLAAGEGPVAGAAFAVGQGINTVASLLFSVGFVILAYCVSQGDTYNKIFAYIATAASLVMVVVTILGAVDALDGETGALVGGICFIVFTLWAITLGREILSSE